MSLVEVMVALTLLAGVMVLFITSFLHSRRVTESSVLNAACTSLVYGIVEQMKGFDYEGLMPSYDIDAAAPAAVRDLPPYIRVRINQDRTVWLRVVHTASGAPQAPTTTPLPTATAASLGAIDNFIGSLPLSTVTGSASQELSLNLWIWIDEIPDTAKDVSEVKKVTVVYTYSYQDGGSTRTIRDREVFLRTRYDQ
ncbi:type IV pilus modification PilV family protein [Horticoccus sp. 23ND18S-11]|uniref:type IV pilus modification PilV family protein n=1 Tax=Horticoccus sp. 23ND18S-11 TaxID=3391832 RepID=UPI0039C9C3A0